MKTNFDKLDDLKLKIRNNITVTSSNLNIKHIVQAGKMYKHIPHRGSLHQLLIEHP